jgi:hypothetical protein
VTITRMTRAAVRKVSLVLLILLLLWLFGGAIVQRWF